MDTVLLEKVLKNRRGMTQSVTTITPRVTGTPLTCPTVEWWNTMTGFVVVWGEEGGVAIAAQVPHSQVIHQQDEHIGGWLAGGPTGQHQ